MQDNGFSAAITKTLSSELLVKSFHFKVTPHNAVLSSGLSQFPFSSEGILLVQAMAIEIQVKKKKKFNILFEAEAPSTRMRFHLKTQTLLRFRCPIHTKTMKTMYRFR